MALNPLTAISTLATGLMGLMLAPCAAEAHTSPATSIDNMRLLIACPAQPDAYDGMSGPMDWDGFAERDILFFNYTGTDLFFTSVIPVRGPISERDVKRVIRMSDCRAEDKYVLVGKDGGVKRRWAGQLSIDELFQTIDAMPMRRFEMRRQRGE